MSEFLRTVVYAKNLPRVERVVRVLLALGVGLAATRVDVQPWLLWLGLTSAITLLVTGFVGFCPACYLAGRKLDRYQND